MSSNKWPRRNSEDSSDANLHRSISSVLQLNANKKSTGKCKLPLPSKTLDPHKNKLYGDRPKSRRYCQNASMDSVASGSFSSPIKETATERFQRHNDLKKRIASPNQSNEPTSPCPDKYSSNNRMVLKRPTLPKEKLKRVTHLKERENAQKPKVSEFSNRIEPKKRKCFWYNKDLKLPRAVTPGIALKQGAHDDVDKDQRLKSVHITNTNQGHHRRHHKRRRKHLISSKNKIYGNIENLHKNSILKRKIKRKENSCNDLHIKQNSNQNLFVNRHKKRYEPYPKPNHYQSSKTSENSDSRPKKELICKICKKKLKDKSQLHRSHRFRDDLRGEI